MSKWKPSSNSTSQKNSHSSASTNPSWRRKMTILPCSSKFAPMTPSSKPKKLTTPSITPIKSSSIKLPSTRTCARQSTWGKGSGRKGRGQGRQRGGWHHHLDISWSLRKSHYIRWYEYVNWLGSLIIEAWVGVDEFADVGCLVFLRDVSGLNEMKY